MDGGIHLYGFDDRRRFADKAKAILSNLETKTRRGEVVLDGDLALNVQYAQAWIALAAL